jgi:trk system potassium uptake protein TrkH
MSFLIFIYFLYSISLTEETTLKKRRLNFSSKSPFLILLGGFAILILLGSLLLKLPFSTKQGQSISYIDSLFLSTSAICVTGLVSSPVPISDLLSTFGKIVLLFLVEIGGLGFITLVTFAFSFTRKKVGVSTSKILKEAMNQNSYKELLPLAKKIVITSFTIQGVGIILNIIAFLIEGFNFFESVWHAIFHTVSAFNNAGFDILGSTSLVNYKNNYLLMINTSTLILLGGLGFVVMFDVLRKRKWKRLSVHTKIVIEMTAIIILLGTILLKLSAYNQITRLDALLQIIFARTAGFYSRDLSTLSYAPLIILMLTMFIGGSPASIAGGIKTTTVYTIVRSVFCFGRGKAHLIAHNREIKNEFRIRIDNSISRCFLIGINYTT